MSPHWSRQLQPTVRVAAFEFAVLVQPRATVLECEIAPEGHEVLTRPAAGPPVLLLFARPR